MTEVSWQIVGVFDPEGNMPDFAYTTGLHELGRPELHLWAQPTHGTDPGDGFKLSHSDMAGVLNMFAQKWVNGDLKTGEEYVHLVDGGDTTLTFTPGETQDRDELDAYQSSPDALVVPLRWSLTRAPEGVDTGADEKTLERIKRLTDEITISMEDLPGHDSDWRAPEGTSIEEEYGPWTPAVTAALVRLELMDEGELMALAIHGVIAGEVGNPRRYVLGKLSSLARRVGRTRAFEKAITATEEALRSAAEKITASGEVTPDQADALAHQAGYTGAAGVCGILLGEHLDDTEWHDATGLLMPHLTPYYTKVDLGEELESVAEYLEEVQSADAPWIMSVASWHTLSDEKRQARTYAQVAAMLAGRGTPWIGPLLDMELYDTMPEELIYAAEDAAEDTLSGLAAEGLVPAEVLELLKADWEPGAYS